MLLFDFRLIGNKLLAVRKSRGLTQGEVAEKSGLSDRTYADIERGTVNMRIETVLKICKALNITPDEIFTEEQSCSVCEADVLARLDSCSENEKKAALDILNVYLNFLNK